ncbi:MAG: 23S rRNA (uracil-5-)-methyltransferase RumA [Candidatus Parcubacteria bacterium]|nr:MAG: 23S rRNA (uracil-5-)-methyltransferase RumA [Candidatus Parcubacteria bacterium]
MSFARVLAERARGVASVLAPREAHYAICSPLQTLPYEAQVRCKEAALSRVLGRRVPVFSSAVIWGYRKKMEFALYGSESGVRLAWHARGGRGRRKVPIDGCALASRRLNELARQAAAALGEVGAWAGDTKALVASESKASGAVALRLVVHGGEELRWRRWQELVGAFPGVAAAQVGYARRETPATTPERVIAGPHEVWLEERVCGVCVRYPAFGFFQNNIWQTEALLIALAEVLAREAPREFVLWDLYAGAAPLSAALARLLEGRVREVFALELDEALAQAARRNLRRVGVAARVVGGDIARTFLRDDDGASTSASEAVAIVDPPRSGLHPVVVRRLLEQGPILLAYVSCNPDTLARDLTLLESVYSLVVLKGFDFYPHTLHLEAFAVLARRA